MYETLNQLSHQVKVSTKTEYLAEHSSEQEEQFVFSYTITIENTSEQAIKLLTRRWLITDADGETSTVEGEGVVGKQPTIKPGTSFTYTSGSVFKTPVGTMQGQYHMIDAELKPFTVEIPVFRLALPNILN